MASEAQNNAHRRDSARRTGSKTEADKARERLSALKNGSRGRKGTPMLPQEDAAELENRTQRWINDLKPRNAVERELVEHAARLSCVIDRANRVERAQLPRRVRKARLKLSGRRKGRVADLGRKLLYNAGPRGFTKSKPAWDDDPAAFRSGLESSAEGCGWLMARWNEIDRLIDGRSAWTWADSYKFARLQGKAPFEAINDPKLNAIFLAWDVLQAGYGEGFWSECKRCSPPHGRGFTEFTRWREISERPQSIEAAWAVLRAIVDDEMARLEELLAVRKEIGDDLADRAVFEASTSFERLRRFRSAKRRELVQTLNTLLDLQKAEARRARGKAKSPDGERRMANGTGPMPNGNGPMPNGNGRGANGNGHSPNGTGHLTGDQGQSTEKRTGTNGDGKHALGKRWSWPTG